MLSLPDLAGRDLPSLRAERRRAQHVAILQDRFRRKAESIGVDPGCRETSRLIETAKAEAAASADREGLIALAIRFAADEASGRPAAAVRETEPRSPAARSFLARALSVLAKGPSA